MGQWLTCRNLSDTYLTSNLPNNLIFPYWYLPSDLFPFACHLPIDHAHVTLPYNLTSLQWRSHISLVTWHPYWSPLGTRSDLFLVNSAWPDRRRHCSCTLCCRLPSCTTYLLPDPLHHLIWRTIWRQCQLPYLPAFLTLWPQPRSSFLRAARRRKQGICALWVTCMLLDHLNPISGRLLATPISGRGGCWGPPLISRDLTGRFSKFKRHSIPFNVIYISKKRKKCKI